MKHETILTRDNGSKVRITAEYLARYTSRIFEEDFFYTHTVDYMSPKQKDWQRIVPGGGERFNDDVAAEWLAEELKYVTKQEIHQAKLELWEKLKPVEGI